jgi:IS5 family transposase
MRVAAVGVDPYRVGHDDVNRCNSRVRSRVEPVFAVVKKLWRFTKVRFRGLAKNGARAIVDTALAGLLLVRRRPLARMRLPGGQGA